MNSLFRLARLTSRLNTPYLPCYTRVQTLKNSFRPVLKALTSRKNRLGPEKPTHRNTFLEWNYDAELYSFGKRLQENFEPALLQRALTERSYIHKLQDEQRNVGIEVDPEDSTNAQDNSEMAERGHQLIEDFVILYTRHVLPYFPEEGIQAVKKYLLNTEILSHISSNIGVSELILTSEFPVIDDTLSRVFKALISALHDTSGAERSSLFIRDFVVAQLAQTHINDLWTIEDPISALNKICQNEGISKPEPRLVGETGRNTLLACYRVGLYVDKQLIGLAPGESVKIAHEMAATDALRRLFRTSEHQLQIPFDLVLDPSAPSVPNISLSEWSEKKVVERLEQVNPPVKKIAQC
ncbi:large ribosomal subunit protein mL44 [Planococcus citri]|uniref:large ribosomal subunit protein mL44 n=1 Tax=Planococcus citri TaxID=170843 RepID=UPI0031F929E1